MDVIFLEVCKHVMSEFELMLSLPLAILELEILQPAEKVR
jgi:hypothetical protein